MSQDRLEEIKYKPYDHPGYLEDIRWLISEAERRRLDAVRAQEYMEEYAGDVVRLEVEVKRLRGAEYKWTRPLRIEIKKLEATIATYRDLLEQCKILVGYAPNGTLWRENIDKALEQGTQD